MLEYLITGTGRCGTFSLYVLLNQGGIKSCHEGLFNIIQHSDNKENDFQVFKEKLNNTDYRGESSWLAAPYLGTELIPTTIKLVHLTRDPLLTIKSFMDLRFFDCHFDTFSLKGKIKNKLEKHKLIKRERLHDEFVGYIKRYMPHIFDNNREEVTLYMKYYVEWNKMIGNQAVKYLHNFRYRIEDPTDQLCDFLSIPKLQTTVYNQKKPNKKESHSLDHLKLRIRKSAFYPEFREYCLSIGYEV